MGSAALSVERVYSSGGMGTVVLQWPWQWYLSGCSCGACVGMAGVFEWAWFWCLSKLNCYP